MASEKVCLVLVALCLVQATIVCTKDDLLLVQILFRHADRTPVRLFKNDHYTKQDFKEGLGQLTAVGKNRMYNYGKLLRQRYSHYIENTLTRNIRAQSSPSRRCLESSPLLLAGLFPPKEPWSNSSELSRLWQPMAVETVEKSRAWLLNSEAYCPAAKHIEDTITAIPEVKKFLDDHKKFIKQLEFYAGEDYSSWYDVGYLWDTLFTEKEYFRDSFVRPDWLDKIGNDTWERLYRFNEMEIGVFDLSPKYQRLRAGPFLTQIISNMNTTAAQKEIDRENHFLTFSSHDTQISYILQALGFFHQSPSYSSGLIIELRRDSQHIPQVHLFYANASNLHQPDSVIYQLPLNQSKTFQTRCHSAHCSLVDFSASLQSFLPDDIEKECAQI